MPNNEYPKERKPGAPQVGLADLRKSHGLTQAQVAARIQAIIDKPFAASSLSTIEGGWRGGSAEVLAALEQVFHLAPGALVVDYKPSHDRRKKAAA